MAPALLREEPVREELEALTAEAAPPELRGAAFGMWNLVAEIGAVLSPVVSGAPGDAAGSWSAPLSWTRP